MHITPIKALVLGTLLSGGTILMSSCIENQKLRNTTHLTEYMNERGNSQEEIDNVIESTSRHSLAKEDAARQSFLDSMAYRDLFNGTHLSNNPASIKELNKIASKIKLENSLAFYNNAEVRCREGFFDALEKDKVNSETVDSLLRNFPARANLLTYNPYDIQNFQHYCDKYFYGEFFKKHGLMTDEFKSKFEALTQKIAPKE